MEQRPIAGAFHSAFHGAFHDYVRGVFAERSTRARLLRVHRARWLRLVAKRAIPGRQAEQRWEGEGGSSR